MMIFRYFLGLALVVAPAAANAQTKGITYDCDTAPGHFSELALPVPSGPVTVSGKLKLLNIAKDPKWAPTARIHFTTSTAPGQSSDRQAGFLLMGVPANKVGLKSDDKNAVVQFLQWDEFRDSSEVKHPPFGLTADAPVYDFSLTFDGQAVLAKIGGQETRIAFTTSDPVVRIICSTGDFLFTDLRISPAK